MQNAFFEWFLPRNWREAVMKASIAMILIVLANVGFAELYLGYQPVGVDYLVLNIILVASPWFGIFMMAMHRQYQSESRLRQLARIDGLTGLLNRNTFLEEVEARVVAGNSGSILMLDADHFKSINDRFGHRAGDACLANIAQRLSNALRTHDLAGRVGGEEFAIFLDGATLDDAMSVTERLLQPIRFRETTECDGQKVTLSIGVAHLPAHGDVGQNLSLADKALYAAKNAGRACLAIWDMDAHAPIVSGQHAEQRILN